MTPSVKATPKFHVYVENTQQQNGSEKTLKINFLSVFALDQTVLLELYLGILGTIFHLLPNYL